MAESRKKLNYDDYTVAIICPLEVEMTAMRYLLDEQHERLQERENDHNRYMLGKLGEHNVAIGYLPYGAQGIGAAATVATDMRRTFPQAQLRLLVGIGGAIPSSKHDLRLGDVVVGMPDGDHGGVVQYDLGKRTVYGFERKGFLCPPPDKWRTAVIEMKSDHRAKRNRINEFLSQMLTTYPTLQDYARPSHMADILFPPETKHVQDEPTCEKCDKSKVVASRTTTDPRIFYGTIASGNSVIKNADERDALSKASGGALCFEMEAAGLTNGFPCVVIRGICDYADSHKNDDWHPYAAAVAAACAKDLLTYMHPILALPVQPTFPVHSTVSRSVNTLFTGRQDVLDDLKSVIEAAATDRGRRERCDIVVTGMGGQGKSEICLQLAHQLRSLFWGIFWVDVSTTTLAENGFLNIASRLGVTVSRWEEARQELANLQQPWLLVLDNADDPDIDYQSYFPATTFGVVLLTSRNDDCEQYAPKKWINLEGLALADAQNLLLRACRVPDARRASLEADAQAVVQLLQSHTLALIQAGSYVSRGHCSLQKYPQVYERQRKRLLTSHPVQAASRYGDVYATFEASAETLRQSETLVAHDALQLLCHLSMYGSSRLPMLLFEAAWEGAQHQIPDDAPSCDLETLTTWHVTRLPALLDIEADAWDSFRFIEALNLLKAFSLVSLDGEASSLSVSMHPLVHAWARDRLSIEQQHTYWVQAGSVVAFSSFSVDLWLREARQLQSHLQAVTTWSMSTMFGSDPKVEIYRVLRYCGWMLNRLRDDTTLLELIKLLCTYLKLERLIVDPQWLDLYDLAGRNRYNSGLITEAVMLLEQVVKIEEKLAEDHPDRLASQHELAGAYQANGQVREAVELLEQVVKIKERTLAEDHPDRLASQHALAGAYQANGQVREAVELLEQVVKIKEKLAEDHPDRLVSEEVLSVYLWQVGDQEMATNLMQRVVNLRRQSLDQGHPDLVRSEEWLDHFNTEVQSRQPQTTSETYGMENIITNSNLEFEHRFSVQWEGRHYLEEEFVLDENISSVLVLWHDVDCIKLTSCADLIGSHDHALLTIVAAILQHLHSTSIPCTRRVEISEGSTWLELEGSWDLNFQSPSTTMLQLCFFARSNRTDVFSSLTQIFRRLAMALRMPHTGLSWSRTTVEMGGQDTQIRLLPIQSAEISACWTPLFSRKVIVLPNDSLHQARELATSCELDIPLDLLISLCAANLLMDVDGGTCLSGTYSLLIPVQVQTSPDGLKKALVWHLLTANSSANKPSRARRQLWYEFSRWSNSNKRLLLQLDDESLQAYERHLLGWTKKAAITLGTVQQPYRLRRSAAPIQSYERAETTFNLGVNIGYGGSGLTASLSVKLGRTEVSRLHDRDQHIVDWLAESVEEQILLYEPVQRQAWLVPKVAVLLQLALERMHYEFSRMSCEPSGLPYLKVQTSDPTIVMKVLKDNLDSSFPSGTGMQKLLKDALLSILSVMDVMERSNLIEGTQRQIMGFEAYDVIHQLPFFRVKKANTSNHFLALRRFGGWVNILEDVPIVLFYKGINDPITPILGARPFCQDCDRVPRGLDCLAATIATLCELGKKYGEKDFDCKQLANQAYWSYQSSWIDSTNTHFCQRLSFQAIWTQRPPDAGPSKSTIRGHYPGAVIFASGTGISASLCS